MISDKQEQYLYSKLKTMAQLITNHDEVYNAAIVKELKKLIYELIIELRIGK